MSKVVPEYVPAYERFVQGFVADLFENPEEWQAFEDVVLEAFDEGVVEEQERLALSWMQDVIVRRGYSQAVTAVCLGVNPSHLGRWLRNINKIPLEQFLRFYTRIAEADGLDHPLAPLERLNLGGYISAVSFCRSFFDHFDRLQQFLTPPINIDQVIELTARFRPTHELKISELLWLNYFFSNHDSINQYSVGVGEEFRKYVLARGLWEIKNTGVLKTYTDIVYGYEALSEWGPAWLICLRVLAKAENGLEKFRVTAKRPIHFQLGVSDA